MSQSKTTFEQKVRALSDEIERTSAKLRGGEGCTSVAYIGFLVAPILVIAVLYLLKPKIVMTEDEHGATVISKRKMAIWTVLLTLALWGGIYGYIYYTGSVGKMFC